MAEQAKLQLAAIAPLTTVSEYNLPKQVVKLNNFIETQWTPASACFVLNYFVWKTTSYEKDYL